jgi:hypothetical protein
MGLDFSEPEMIIPGNFMHFMHFKSPSFYENRKTLNGII